MPERERGLRRRRNAGQDASGTHHDIARDVLPPPEMLSGTRTSCENPWRFVLGCLSTSSGSVDPPPCVKMLETALMGDTGGGQVEHFFFTGADGTVHRKAERSLRYSIVRYRMDFEIRCVVLGSGKLRLPLSAFSRHQWPSCSFGIALQPPVSSFCTSSVDVKSIMKFPMSQYSSQQAMFSVSTHVCTKVSKNKVKHHQKERRLDEGVVVCVRLYSPRVHVN